MFFCVLYLQITVFNIYDLYNQSIGVPSQNPDLGSSHDVCTISWSLLSIDYNEVAECQLLFPTVQEMLVVDDHHVLFVLPLCPSVRDFSMLPSAEHVQQILSVLWWLADWPAASLLWHFCIRDHVLNVQIEKCNNTPRNMELRTKIKWHRFIYGPRCMYMYQCKQETHPSAIRERPTSVLRCQRQRLWEIMKPWSVTVHGNVTVWFTRRRSASRSWRSRPPALWNASWTSGPRHTILPTTTALSRFVNQSSTHHCLFCLKVSWSMAGFILHSSFSCFRFFSVLRSSSLSQVSTAMFTLRWFIKSNSVTHWRDCVTSELRKQ